MPPHENSPEYWLRKAGPVELEQMEAEVLQYRRDKGWYDEEVPFEDAMALLHEEAAEAGAAWRKWGLQDATGRQGCDDPLHGDSTREHECYTVTPPKPEGVGSEFADFLIRLLGESTRYGLKLAQAYQRLGNGWYAVSDRFLTNINTLHGLVARASMEYSAYGTPEHGAVNLAGAMAFVMQLAELYGIDLEAEYARKMEYNRTRPYRHGGRRA